MVEWLSPEAASVARATETALQKFEDEQRKMVELQQKVTEDSITVRAKDRSLQMTFDGRGELTAMKFLGTKFRSMAPPELAHLIVETVRAGRAQAMEKLGEVFSASLPGLDFADLVAGKAGAGQVAEAMFGPALEEISSILGGGLSVKDSRPGKEK